MNGERYHYKMHSPGSALEGFFSEEKLTDSSLHRKCDTMLRPRMQCYERKKNGDCGLHKLHLQLMNSPSPIQTFSIFKAGRCKSLATKLQLINQQALCVPARLHSCLRHEQKETDGEFNTLLSKGKL